MKLLMTILLLVGIGFAQQGEMVRAEPLTTADQEARRKAYDQLTKAQANVRDVEFKIADSHHMKNENYMEWSTHFEFDGGFIVLRHSSMEILTKEPSVRTIPYDGPLPMISQPATISMPPKYLNQGDTITVLATPEPSTPEPGNVIVFQPNGTEPKRLMWANKDNTGSCTIEIVP